MMQRPPRREVNASHAAYIDAATGKLGSLAANARTGRLQLRKGLSYLAPVVGLTLASFLLYRAFRTLDLAEVQRALRSLTPGHLAAAAVLTMASFAALTGFDGAGVRYVGRRLSYRRIAFTSFLAMSIGHTLGLAALSSGAIRLRLYTAFGLTAAAVAQIIAMCAITVILGVSTLAGVSALASPRETARFLELSPAVTTAIGALLVSIGAGYLVMVAVTPPKWRIFGYRLRRPTFSVALQQLVVGTLDFLLVAGVLHQLLAAAGAEVDYMTVAMLYAVATIAAIVAHVPGGLGVTEAVVLSLLPSARVAGALLVFRLVYYLIPFVLGCVLLAAFELTRAGSDER